MALVPTNPTSPEDKQAAEADVLLREVDDALREDQLMHFLRSHGRNLAIAVVAGLLALAGYLWWQASSKSAAGERGEQLTMALDRVESGNLAAGDKQLKALAQDDAAGAGTAAAARLMRGGIALEQGRREEAIKLFAAVAADGDAPQPFRDLATVREIATAFDTMPVDKVVARLKPLAVPGNPWFGNAGELLGMAYLKQGKRELAGPLFAAISRDKDAPESLRRRARQMAGLLGVDAIDDPEKIISEAAANGAAANPAAGQP